MNFASLIKHHEIRQPTSVTNQFMINCNRRNQNSIIHILDNNLSGVKRKTVEPNCPKMTQIYENFQNDHSTQWILEIQNSRVKLHKFKPSKIKTKKTENDKQINDTQIYGQQVRPSHHKKQCVNINPAIEQQDEQQFVQPETQRKNYSPMRQLRPRNFGKNQNWMENLNRNKFSFGDDSSHVSDKDQPRVQPSQCQTQRQNNSEKRDLQNLNNGVNLIGEFQRCSQTNNCQYNRAEGQSIKGKNINPLVNYEPESNKRIVKCSQADPDSMIDFNLDVGFSFEQFEKTKQSDQNGKQQKIQNQEISVEKVQPRQAQTVHAFKTDNNIYQMDEFIIKATQKQVKIIKPNQQTSLKVIVDDIQKMQDKTVYKLEEKVSNNDKYDSNTKQQKQSSPNVIYCKSNVRNLTPQKFKYPRIQSKVQLNSGIKEFNINELTKNKTENNIVPANKQIENVQSKKQIDSSKRLQVLIDESNKIIENRNNHIGQIQDRITRIVLHQPTVNQNRIVNLEDKNTQNQPEIHIKSPPLKQKQQKVKNQISPTPEPKQFNTTDHLSPKSPTQQKPKFHNQLANMETNFTSEKQQSAGKPQLTNYIRHTDNNSYNVPTGLPLNKNAQMVQQNNLQSNYAYKPVGIPQNRTIEMNNQINIRPVSYQVNDAGVQRNVQPYHINQAQCDTTVKTYSPYFPVGNHADSNFKVTTNNTNLIPVTEIKPIQTYQTYTYTGGSNQISTTQMNTQPLSNNNYIKINNQYVSPLQNLEYRPFVGRGQTTYGNVKNNLKQKENQKPGFNNFGWQGIKCVESNIYDPSSKYSNLNTINQIHSDPKESSIEFSLRIQEHFHIAGK